MTNLQRILDRTPLEQHIAKNRGTCKKCGLRFFWCSTANGKRIPMDFPDTALGHEPTHELVVGYKDGGEWDGTVEAWKSNHHLTHSCHFDTCKGDPEENRRKEIAAYDARRKAERDAVVSEGWNR